jgi:hypothetical protein
VLALCDGCWWLHTVCCAACCAMRCAATRPIPDAPRQVEQKLKESSERLMAFERDFVHSKRHEG